LSYSIRHGKEVSKCINQTVVSMACGGSATIFLYENGSWGCTEGLLRGLYNKLNGRRRKLPSPVYVAMGSQDRYYIKFADGSSQFVGCDDLVKELQQKSNVRVVKTVAFGVDWDSYFIVYTDGWWSSRNVPIGLTDLIKKRQSRADLHCVSLGPNGEYFLSAKKWTKVVGWHDY
jgi:hypothetical protein